MAYKLQEGKVPTVVIVQSEVFENVEYVFMYLLIYISRYASTVVTEIGEAA